jgi:hypothetical protein
MYIYFARMNINKKRGSLQNEKLKINNLKSDKKQNEYLNAIARSPTD